MYVPIHTLPSHSRIWIYQSDKKLTSVHQDILSTALRSFTEQWSVHGAPMNASFEIRFDQFVILAADDQASGCSIDSSVRLIKNVGESVDVNFFDRTLIAFKKEGEVELIRLNELKLKLQEGYWNNNSLVFNNLITNLGALNDAWILPAASTWLKRYLPKEAITH